MSLPATIDRASLETLPFVPHDHMDWSLVTNSTYVIRQRLRYDYAAPAAALRQRLMIVPPSRHGDQRCIAWWVDASQPVRRRDWRDRFGNRVIDMEVERVDEAIEFVSCIALERRSTIRPHRVAGDCMFARSTKLTQPDAALTSAGRALRLGRGGAALAERICAWVHDHLEYQDGVTTVATTAAKALEGGAGVCQDFAHVMVSLCRLVGLPARYVSGHLLGEGGSHAWVEVLLPDPDRAGGCIALALDPTHNRPAGLSYVTVATGRDYGDVAPTSGTYRGTGVGSLEARKQVGIATAECRMSRSG